MRKFIFTYRTTNRVNGKCYVGIHATDNIYDGYIGCGIFKPSDAWRGLLLHKAVRKYGYRSFKREIISFHDNYQDALSEEKIIVDKNWVKSTSNYNTALGGKGGAIYGLSEEVKRRMYDAISLKSKGRKRSDEARKNISIGKLGVRFSDEHKAALSKSSARFWLGKKMPIEIIEKSRLARIGRKISESHRKRLSESHKGKPSKKRIAVVQCLLDGTPVREFNSYSDAAVIIGCSKTSIMGSVKGIKKQFRGYIFKAKTAA